MNGWVVCLVLQGESGSRGLHSRGRNASHLRMARDHQQGHNSIRRMRMPCQEGLLSRKDAEPGEGC